MRFSDALNCIIGGRGTGKSSILKMLEYIMAQRVESDKTLDFLCQHGNAYVLYEKATKATETNQNQRRPTETNEK